MKNKKILIWGGIIVEVVILAVVCLIISIKRDSEKTNNNMEKINEYYDSFISNVNEYNNKRDSFINFINKDVYVTNLDKKYEEVNKYAKEYDSIISKLSIDNNNLKELCIYNYSNDMVNKRCDNSSDSYDEIIKIYKSDIDGYNQIIKNYNDMYKNTDGYNEINELKSENIGW